jgi:hypothetical protein
MLLAGPADWPIGLLHYHAIHCLSNERERYFSYSHRSHEQRPFPPPHHGCPGSGSCSCFTAPPRGSSSSCPPRRSQYCSWCCSVRSPCCSCHYSCCCSCSCSAPSNDADRCRSGAEALRPRFLLRLGHVAAPMQMTEEAALRYDAYCKCTINVSNVIEICFIRMLQK